MNKVRRSVKRNVSEFTEFTDLINIYFQYINKPCVELQEQEQRSQAAATEINPLVSSSVDGAEKARNMLTKLVPDIQKTAELVQEISAASNEQS